LVAAENIDAGLNFVGFVVAVPVVCEGGHCVHTGDEDGGGCVG
jgi:hypothetical protein